MLFQHKHRALRGELRRTGVDRQRGLEDATKLLRARMDVDERLPGKRRLDERVAAGRHLTEPRSDDEQQIGLGDPLRQLRIDPDTNVAQ